MESAFPEGSEVQKDESKNRFLFIYLSVLGTAGIGLMVLTVLYDWGFWGWFGGGFLIVAGLGGLGGMAKTGGAGELSCPQCGGLIKVMHIGEHRTIPCPHCGVYLEGTDRMTLVPEDRVANERVFLAPLPDQFEWPEGCPVCGAPVTRKVKMQATHLGGDMAAMLSPISLRRVYSLQAPACDQHDDGVGLRVVDKDKFEISFRSRPYWKRFRELNGIR